MQKTELFYRPMPADAEAERRVLCALLLAADGPGHPAFGELDRKDFCLGSMGFNGWLFAKIRSGRQTRQSTLSYLLRRSHRREAAAMGVGNLPAALGRLLTGPDGRYRPGWVSNLPEQIARLRAVRAARRAIWDAEQAYAKAWAEWDEHERSGP